MSYIENTKDFDPVRPGEQWFFYWKTSASLWEGRILQFPQNEIVFLPLYWGFHAESSSEWDFGKLHPERDLLRLTQLLTQHGRKFCWLLPLSPAPFLPNGGVTAYAARTLSVSREGVHLAVLDHEQLLNKMFSFFEPKVFQSYSSFLKAFGTFLTSNKIKAPLWGVDFCYFQDQEKISYLEDCSLAFEQGFSRYLKQNNPDGDLNEAKREAELKKIFTHEVANLFRSAGENALGPYWMGVKNIVFLGGSPKDTIIRSLPGGKSQFDFTRELFHHYIHSDWISSSLLGKEEKKEVLQWILKEHFGSRDVDERFQYSASNGNLTSEFRPYGLVDVITGKKQTYFSQVGLYQFLEEHFRGLYQTQEEFTFSPENIDLNEHKIKIFHGAELNRTSFGQMLKLFMMGQRVLLDRSGIPDGLDKRLQIFLVENSIKFQSVNFMTLTQICELGEGRLVIFEGGQLIQNSAKEKFWMNIFRYFSLIQPEIQMDTDVFSLWRIRGTTPHELTYLDVRRVNIYNPTSYKKQVSIRTHRHFAFMKMIDPTRASARSTTEGVDVELLPNGKIALDFGRYEES